jgi:hypothetical protein
MVLVSEQRLSSCLKGREQICTMQTRESMKGVLVVLSLKRAMTLS